MSYDFHRLTIQLGEVSNAYESDQMPSFMKLRIQVNRVRQFKYFSLLLFSMTVCFFVSPNQLAWADPMVNVDSDMHCQKTFEMDQHPFVKKAEVPKQVRFWPSVSSPSDPLMLIEAYPALFPFAKSLSRFNQWRFYIANPSGFNGGSNAPNFRYYMGKVIKSSFLGLKTRLEISLRKEIDKRRGARPLPGAGLSLEITGQDALKVLAADVLQTDETDLRKRLAAEFKRVDPISSAERHMITFKNAMYIAAFEFYGGAKLDRAVIRPNFKSPLEEAGLDPEQSEKLTEFFRLSEKILMD